jgi:adenosylhomocysteine nucleosidase
MRVGIVTAMPTEVWPLVRDWARKTAALNGQQHRFYQRDDATVLCGGIGYNAGRCAAKAMIEFANPDLLVAAGLAGGLRRQWTLGRTLCPGSVIDAESGARLQFSGGSGVVVSSRVIAGAPHKRELAARFLDAEVVDMEGFAVAEVAQEHGIPVIAAKAISDELDFDLPPLQKFVDRAGRFQALRFTAHAAFHPRWWPVIAKLKHHSDLAAATLAPVLAEIVGAPDKFLTRTPKPATHV